MAGKARLARAPANPHARANLSIVVASRIGRWQAPHSEGRCLDPAQECVIGEFCEHRSPSFRMSRSAGERKNNRSGPIAVSQAAIRDAINLDVAGCRRTARRRPDDIPGATAHFAFVQMGKPNPVSTLRNRYYITYPVGYHYHTPYAIEGGDVNRCLTRRVRKLS